MLHFCFFWLWAQSGEAVVSGTPDAATIAAIVTAVLDAQAASAKSAA